MAKKKVGKGRKRQPGKRAKGKQASAEPKPTTWKLKPMSDDRTEEILKIAHKALDETVRKRLQVLKSTTHVTAEKLERIAKGCADETGRSMLVEMLHLEPWFEKMESATHVACPECETTCERTRGKDGKLLWEDVQLETILGAVPWHAPLFNCTRCRRFFSPRQAVT
jgi:hypothetical protein